MGVPVGVTTDERIPRRDVVLDPGVSASMFSRTGRCRNDAAFAASPLLASSGRNHRHRLNRGGDRQLNRALHTIMLTRWQDRDRTRSYIEKRRNEGETDREIRRCIKRYIARELFRALTNTNAGA